MTDPHMTPTNDAPVSVEQCDRDGCAEFELFVGRINERDAERIRAGEWDETKDVLWFARHRLRLAALASAPAGDAFADAGKPIVPAGDGVEQAAREAVTLIDEINAAPSSRNFYGIGPGTTGKLATIRATLATALDRPRAAVGEQSREAIARVIEPSAWDHFDRAVRPYAEGRGSQGDENYWYQRTWADGCRTAGDVREWWLTKRHDVMLLDVFAVRDSLSKADAILALQSSPAKVEE